MRLFFRPFGSMYHGARGVADLQNIFIHAELRCAGVSDQRPTFRIYIVPMNQKRSPTDLNWSLSAYNISVIPLSFMIHAHISFAPDTLVRTSIDHRRALTTYRDIIILCIVRVSKGVVAFDRCMRSFETARILDGRPTCRRLMRPRDLSIEYNVINIVTCARANNVVGSQSGNYRLSKNVRYTAGERTFGGTYM